MHICDEKSRDLTIDGVYYKLSDVAECKRMGRLRGTKGVEFPDYQFTFGRLEELHKQQLAQRRAERKAT